MVDDCCKNIGIFQKLGAVGSATFDSKRTIFMGISVVLTAFCWIFTIVAMAGSSVDNDTVQNCAWTYQDAHGYEFYYGTYRFVVDPSSASVPNTNWEDCSTDMCNDCEDAGVTANNCAVVTFIMLFFFIGLSVARALPAQDTVMFKATFIIMSAVNILVMIIGMGSWDDQCVDHITDGEVNPGPGLNCYIATFFFMMFATAIHLFTPIPAEGGTSETMNTDGDADSYKPYEESFVNEK